MPARFHRHLHGENGDAVVQIPKRLFDTAHRFEATLLHRGDQSGEIGTGRRANEELALDRVLRDPRVHIRDHLLQVVFAYDGRRYALHILLEVPRRFRHALDLRAEVARLAAVSEIEPLLPGQDPKLHQAHERVLVEGSGPSLGHCPHPPLVRALPQLRVVALRDDIRHARRHELTESVRVRVVDRAQLGNGHVVVRHVGHERRPCRCGAATKERYGQHGANEHVRQASPGECCAHQKQREQPEAGSARACRRCSALALVATPVIEPMRRLPEKTEIFFRVVDVLGPAAEAYPHGVGVVAQSIDEIGLPFDEGVSASGAAPRRVNLDLCLGLALPQAFHAERDFQSAKPSRLVRFDVSDLAAEDGMGRRKPLGRGQLHAGARSRVARLEQARKSKKRHE